MSRRPNRCARFILIPACVLVVGSSAQAENRRWNNGTASLVFNTGGNWVGGVTPGSLDVAQFGLSPPPPFFRQTYTVSFNNNATNQALHIEDDLVRFNLNSRTYTLTTATGMLIGTGGFAARLTVTNGTIRSTTGSNFDVGASASSGGGELVVSTNGLISGSPNLKIGTLITGTLTVEQGGDISTTGTTTIGVGDGITATATVFGEGSTLVTGALNVGSIGDGTVNVQLGGLLQNNGGARLGTGSLLTGVGTGTVNVMNAGSTWNSLGLLEIGDGGTGEVNITQGGAVNAADSIIGANVSGGGEVNVTGLNSLWDNSGTVTIGGLGGGTLNITNQGVVENTDGFIANSALGGSNGTVDVSGFGSGWINSDDLTVGHVGTGTLTINGGGFVGSDYAFVGFESSGTGTVTVKGFGSIWQTSQNLFVGFRGQGTVNITAGGSVQNTTGFVGDDSDSTGLVTVDGDDSVWQNSGDLFVGFFGEGTLNITGGGTVGCVEGTVGSQSSAIGHVTVDGDGSLWEYSGAVTVGETDPGSGLQPDDLTVGNEGDGTLEITNGGHVVSTFPGGVVLNSIGSGSSGTGYVLVTGDGSRWNAGDDNGVVAIGNAGNGTLDIFDGGTVQAAVSYVGAESSASGHVTVDGDGSLWDSGRLFVGLDGRGTLEITGGGVVQSVDGAISGPVGAPSAVIVSGPGSQWDMSGALSVGYSTDSTTARVGTLDITDRGIVTTNEIAFLGLIENTTGIVTVAGAGSTWEIVGPLRIGCDSVNNTGVGTVGIQGGTVSITENTSVSAGDLLSLAAGTLSTTQISFPDGGNADTNFEWTSGTLHVGFFDGDLVNQAGVLAPGNSVGITEIIGNYNQLADATLEIEISGTTMHDFVRVIGNAFLGGDLELDLLNGFVPSSTDTFIVLRANLNVFNAFANVANGQRLATSDGLGSFVVNYGASSAFAPDLIALSNFLAADVPGDCDHDGDVDLDDYSLFPDCLDGPGVTGSIQCECFDLNHDGAVDLADFAVFRLALTGL